MENPNSEINQNDFTSDLEMHKNYDTVEKFIQAGEEENLLRIVLTSLVGTGKSTLACKLAGVHLVYNDEESDETESGYGNLRRVPKPGCPYDEPPFKGGSTQESVTKRTSFVISHFMGDENKEKLMIIDTPGLFDNDQARVDEIIEDKNDENDFVGDMTAKLRAVGKIHAILVLMKLDSGGRLDLTFMKTMDAINEMFSKNNCNLSKNFIFAFARCDENRSEDFTKYVKRKEKIYSGIYDALVENNVNVTQKVPEHLFFLSSKNPDETRVSQSSEFQRLYEVLGNCPDLDTRRLQCPKKYMNSKIFIYLFYLFY